MTNTVKIAAIQMDCSKDPQTNLQNALEKIKQAAEKGAQIICLPELFRTVYFCADGRNEKAFDLAEPVNGETVQALAKAARDNKVYIVGGSIYERGDDGKLYNTAVTFNDEGEVISTYRKCHIPNDPGFEEQFYFTPGDEIKIVDTKYGKLGVLICYDQWFPEAARLAVLKGAQILVYPTAIGMPEGVENITGDWRAMWQGAQTGHACSNNVYVVAINRTGREVLESGATSDFFGGSFICDFAGKKLAEAKEGEAVLVAECDLARQQQVQKAWRFIVERRPDLYGDLAKDK
jgi:predicted amidohydrolase